MTRLAEPPASRVGWSVMPVLLIWLAFVGWSLMRVPVPGVNEPHYLSKSRHFWNPEWCPGDFFLDSSNPHLVFYSTFGWLTSIASLPTAAVLGRTLGLLIVACGWQRLSTSITGNRWLGLLSVPLLLALQALGNLSGEWLIGGIEAKVPAYGLLFWGLGDFLQQRYVRSALTCGLAISLHPLVGLWGMVALGMSLLPQMVRSIRSPSMKEQDNARTLRLPGRGTWLVMGGICILAALPGLLPAFAVIGGNDPSLELYANRLQVADRLAHHLDPMKFPKEAYRYWGMMIVLWLLLAEHLPKTSQQHWWKNYVFSSIAIVLLGVLIGWGPRPVEQMPGYAWRIGLLKFYFFRMGDQFVPLALSLCAAQRGLEWFRSGNAAKRRNWCSLTSLTAAVLAALFVPFPDANPGRMNAAERRDWSEACRWVRDHSSPANLVHATETGWAIKWYAERPEYVSFKDMPQDAAAISEWNRRLWVMADWKTGTMLDGRASAAELESLRAETFIRYLICHRFGPVELQPVFENSTFRVYELPVSK